MDARLLRLATSRRLGFRSWDTSRGFVKAIAPSRNNFGWFFLQWSVEGGTRGLDYMRHKGLRPRSGLSRGAALDLIHGTDKTGIRAVL